MKKTKIDLANPIYKPFIDLYEMKCHEALNTTINLENAVFPVYGLLKKNKPEHIGSCVLVNIKSKFFIFSASHVFDVIGKNPISIGIGKGRELLTFGGDRFSTGKGKSGTHQDDYIDASVFPVTIDLPVDIQKRALDYNDLDLSENVDNKDIHIISGIRLRKSYAVENQAYAKAEAFPSIKINLDDYPSYSLNKEYHLALVYESYRLVKGHKQKTPKLIGMSGGGIFKSKEVNIPAVQKIEKKLKPLLSAITIHYEPEKCNKEGIVVGTSVRVHLALIEKYMPDFLKNNS